MSPFVPVGERARWRVIYDLLIEMQVGDVLTYNKMAMALELDPHADRHTLQVAMRRAADEYLMSHNHAVEAVINKGYRVVEAPEHVHLAQKHQKRSRRALVRGHKTIVHVDMEALDEETRKAFDIVAAALAAQMDFSRRLDIRQRFLEKSLKEVQEGQQQAQQRTQEELRAMQERLERLEAAQQAG